MLAYLGRRRRMQEAALANLPSSPTDYRKSQHHQHKHEEELLCILNKHSNQWLEWLDDGMALESRMKVWRQAAVKVGRIQIASPILHDFRTATPPRTHRSIIQQPRTETSNASMHPRCFAPCARRSHMKSYRSDVSRVKLSRVESLRISYTTPRLIVCPFPCS